MIDIGPQIQKQIGVGTLPILNFVSPFNWKFNVKITPVNILATTATHFKINLIGWVSLSNKNTRFAAKRKGTGISANSSDFEIISSLLYLIGHIRYFLYLRVGHTPRKFGLCKTF